MGNGRTPSPETFMQPEREDYQDFTGHGAAAIGADGFSPDPGATRRPTFAPSPMRENAPSPVQTPPVAAPTPDSDLDLRAVLTVDHPLVNVMRMERPADSVIEGKPLYLHELLKGVYSSRNKQHLVKEYWALTEKYLIYKYRVMQYALLTNPLYASFQGNTTITSQLDSAILMVARQQKAAELEFIQAQHCFSEQIKLHGGYVCSNEQNPSGLFVPVDAPIAMPYNTRSDRLHLVSTRAKLLDKTIPLQYEVVQNRQEAFQASESYLMSVVSAGESPVSGLAICIDEQIALLRAIVEYNHQIVDYVTETVGGEVSGKRYLSTILHLQNPPGDQPSNAMSETFPVTQAGYVQE